MESLHYLLMKTHAMFYRKIQAEIGKIGLTSGQPKILEFLQKYKEADQKTIASYCEIEQATVGSILLRMETAGLVVRRQKEGNRRSLYVSMTEKGEKAAQQLTGIFQSVEANAASELSENEVTALKELLTKLSDSMQTQAAEKEAGK